MTCQDCIYYKPINEKEGKCNSPMDAYYGFDTTMVGDLGKCEYFKPIHESVGNALDALKTIPKGGQIKPHMLHGWVYDDPWESVSK